MNSRSGNWSPAILRSRPESTGRATKANGVPEAVKSNTVKIKRKAAPSVAVKNRVKV